MPHANVDTLRAAYDAIERADWRAAFDCAWPDFELRTPDQNPIGGTYRGRDAARGFLTELWAAFEEVTIEPVQFIERDDRILALLRLRLRPSDSTSHLEMRVHHLWTMRAGKAARCEIYTELEQALDAAGLMKDDVRA